MCPCCQFRGVDWTTDARPMYVSLSQCLPLIGFGGRGFSRDASSKVAFFAAKAPPASQLTLGDFRPPVACVADDALFVHAGQLSGVQQLFAADPKVLDAGASAGIEQL